MNGTRVHKGGTKALVTGNRVALYYPQGAAALGRPILYDVELNADAFEKVCVCVCVWSGTFHVVLGFLRVMRVFCGHK